MSETESVCKNCGIIAGEHDSIARINAEEPCESPGGHDWSDDDPMARVLAKLSCWTDEAPLVEKSDGDGWQWFEVALEDHDEVGASESVASAAQAEGFSFTGVDEAESGATTLRFSREKDE